MVLVRWPVRCKQRVAERSQRKYDPNNAASLPLNQITKMAAPVFTEMCRSWAFWKQCLRWSEHEDTSSPDVRQYCRYPRSQCLGAGSSACCDSCPRAPTRCRRRRDPSSSWRRALEQTRRLDAGTSRRTCTTVSRLCRRRDSVCS